MISQEQYPHLKWRPRENPIQPIQEGYRSYRRLVCWHDFWEEPNKNWKQCQKCGAVIKKEYIIFNDK